MKCTTRMLGLILSFSFIMASWADDTLSNSTSGDQTTSDDTPAVPDAPPQPADDNESDDNGNDNPATDSPSDITVPPPPGDEVEVATTGPAKASVFRRRCLCRRLLGRFRR